MFLVGVYLSLQASIYSGKAWNITGEPCDVLVEATAMARESGRAIEASALDEESSRA